MKLYKVFFFLFVMGFMSCSDDDKAIAQTFNYEQYGVPFANMPAASDAIIYQVNIRSFSPEGNLNGVRQKLSYIKDLGVNVIYLMPIYPIAQVNQAGANGSPYAVQDYKAVNPNFGTLEDLRALVNEAHQMDMAVVLDWVANHTGYDNAWITQHPDWYVHDAEGNFTPPPGTNWADVAQLDFTNTDMRKAMIDAMAYWVYNANIDGFRCDAADYVSQSFWAEANTAVRSIKKNQHLIMLAEGTRINHFTAGFDYTFGFGFFSALETTFADNLPATNLQNANAAEYANNYNNNWRIVRYTTNHDVNLSDGTPLELFNGANGSMAAFVVASYMKSVPMIYNAQEIGYNQRIDYFSDNAPINWSNPNNDMLAQYKQLIAFRKSSKAVKEGTYTGYSSNAVSAFTMEKDGEKVLVIANLTNANANYILPAQLSAINWTNALNGNAAGLSSNISLAPYQYWILKN